MGSGASNPYNELPERLNRNQLEVVCGDRFDADVFHHLQDQSDGLVPRSRFLEWISDDQETAVYDRYLFYQQDASMSKRELVSLLRDSKLLRKNVFVVADVDIIDKECQNDKLYSDSTHIPYQVFRTVIIPKIANKTKDTVAHILYRISQCEERVVHRYGSLCDGKDESAREIPNDDQIRAANIITRCAKAKLARNEVASRRDLNAVSEEGYNPETDFIPATDDTSLEGLVQEKYMKYASKIEGTISLGKILELLQENDVFSAKFTRESATKLFKIVKVKTQAANAPFDIKKCLVSNKYLRYVAFRSIFLPMVAEAKGMALHDLLHYFTD